MIYQVTRTSNPYNDENPCRGLFRPKVKRVILPPVVEDGRPIICWELELNTLQDLNVFVKEEGQCILNDSHIEIYDDYRE